MELILSLGHIVCSRLGQVRGTRFCDKVDLTLCNLLFVSQKF